MALKYIYDFGDGAQFGPFLAADLRVKRGNGGIQGFKKSCVLCGDCDAGAFPWRQVLADFVFLNHGGKGGLPVFRGAN